MWSFYWPTRWAGHRRTARITPANSNLRPERAFVFVAVLPCFCLRSSFRLLCKLLFCSSWFFLLSAVRNQDSFPCFFCFGRMLIRHGTTTARSAVPSRTGILRIFQCNAYFSVNLILIFFHRCSFFKGSVCCSITGLRSCAGPDVQLRFPSHNPTHPALSRDRLGMVRPVNIGQHTNPDRFRYEKRSGFYEAAVN